MYYYEWRCNHAAIESKKFDFKMVDPTDCATFVIFYISERKMEVKSQNH